MPKPKVSLVKCPNYDPLLVEKAAREAVDLVGGVAAFVRPSSKVLVKPNLLMAAAPEAGITTHPEVVRSVIRILKDTSCQIFVGDEPSSWNHNSENVDYVYEKTGILKVCLQEGVELVKFNKKSWKGKFPLFSWADEADVIINVPKFKTHQLTILTGAIKNLYGFVSGSYKAELHKQHFRSNDFCRALVDIFELVRPALTFIDGIVAMEGDGPASGGKLRNINLVLCGTDCLAVDSVLAAIMGLRPSDIIYIKEAAKRGLGVSDLSDIDILGEPLDRIAVHDFILPTASVVNRMPSIVGEMVKKLIKLRPVVLHQDCIRCGACVKICPQKIITIKDNKVNIDYSKCIACFCCQEACPASAIKVRKSLMARFLGL